MTISGLHCGGCDHFNRVRAPVFSDVCSKLGVTKEAAPCKAFAPMPTSVTMNRRHDAPRALARILIHTPSSDLASLAAMIAKEHITRKYGFHFGQPVYIRVFGDGSYRNHYAKALVTRADRKWVFVQGAGKKNFSGQLYHGSVLTVEQFHKLRVKMVKQGKLVDPKAKAFFGPMAEPVRDIAKLGKIHPKHGLAGTKERPVIGKRTILIGRKPVSIKTTAVPEKFDVISLRGE